MPHKQKPYPVRVLSHIARLPDYIAIQQSKINNLSQEISSARQQISELVDEKTKLAEDLAAVKNQYQHFDNLDDRVVSLQSKLSSLQTNAQDGQAPSSSQPALLVVNNTVADNHSFDSFYKKFEDKFRGSESLIQDRVAEHLPLFNNLLPSLKKKRIIDIGCGRGEFLTVLKEAGFEGIGVDMNEDMVKRANSIGLKAVQNDAWSYLSSIKTGSLAAITGFHIVEHIPFESLMEIFTECYRTLARGGFVLFETPNPRSLNVGANIFYTDPSHIKPIPPELLAFMLEYTGFEANIIELHRSEPELETNVPGLKRVHDTVFGYSDYAVVGKKISLS